MSNLDWNTVIKLKEFIEHLSNKDLIQLSMSSKKSRKFLTKEAFDTFNLLSFTSSKDYSSISFDEKADKDDEEFDSFINPYKPLTEKLTESKMKFSKDLKLFNGYPKNLVVNSFGRYHYLLSEISIIFPNITILALNCSTFTADALQSLFDNFKCLEKLGLTKVLILHDAEISNDYTITYPISLRSLKLYVNRVAMVQGKINSIVNDRYVVDARTYQHLPNLVTFDHFMGVSSSEKKEDLFEFIRLNPQLKCLKLSGNDFNVELFDIIKDYENLTHLELTCELDKDDLIGYEMPVLRHIKHLYLEAVDVDYSRFIMYKFPNVKEFTFEFNGEYTRKNKWLIEHFGNLKSLKLIFNEPYNYFKKFTINEMSYLENIEFNFNYEKGRFDPIDLNVKICKKLKLITYTKYAYSAPFENSEENQNHIKNWDYIYFPYKLAYHKKSK